MTRADRALVRGLTGIGAGLLVMAIAGCSSGGSDSAPSTTAPKTTTTTEAIEPARDFSDPGVAVIAHRGASGYAPEHTFAAYDLAVEQGADYLEQDVHLTKDGQLVVIHDDTLDRTAHGPADRCTGPVNERTVADLDACEVGSWFNDVNPDLADPAFADEHIPTLADVFDRYGSDVRYYIEVKAPDEQPGMEDALLDLLEEADIQAGDADLPPVVIQSFSGDSLQRIHERRPDLPLVRLLPNGAPPLDAAALADIATYAVAIGPPKATVTAELVAAANEQCLDVHPYTVDDPEEMGALLADGVGAMFTNKPDVLAGAVDDAAPNDGHCASAATASS